MSKVTHSKRARRDLLTIWAYIAEDSPNAADKLLDTLNEKCALLGENSELGQARPDITPEMRYFPVKKYLILYRKTAKGIEVVRFLHGARDLGGALYSD